MTSAPSYQEIERAAKHRDLAVLGALHPRHSPVQDLTGGTLVLLGLLGPECWTRITGAPEFSDAATDPLDRWSKRIIDALATDTGATAHYPFGGPPYTPFINWALASGRAFTSPSHMLVHDTVGMMISYRGALHLQQEIDLPPPPMAQSPCDSCVARPCLSTCPVQALVAGGPYGVTACHSHLDTPEGAPCLENGCLARLACPLSQGASRDPVQSAHHMSYFHKT